MARLLRIMLAALASFVAVPAAAQTPVERHGQLSVRGNRIVDQQGEPVVLRGMSLFWSQWQPRFYNRDAVRWLRDDWHVNVVRAAIGVHHGGYVEHPAREMAKAEAVIDAAIEGEIYVIVDWHAHLPAPKEARAFFSHIAKKYGAYPNIIYETWNEPLQEHDWKTVIKPYHEAVVPSIRAHDPDNLIVAGTQTWSQDVDKAAANPIEDPNLAYTLHFYAGTHRQELRDKAQEALDAGAAIFVTEWGTTLANGDDKIDEAETRLWWDFMEKNQVSYLNWSIADKKELSAALLKGASSRGGWPDRVISRSGRLVREQLRRRNVEPSVVSETR